VCSSEETEAKANKKIKANVLLENLLNKDIICFLFLLWDILAILAKVSLAFQGRNATLADIFTEIEAAKLSLDGLKVINCIRNKNQTTIMMVTNYKKIWLILKSVKKCCWKIYYTIYRKKI
jgi:hypothetical protein